MPRKPKQPKVVEGEVVRLASVEEVAQSPDDVAPVGERLLAAQQKMLSLMTSYEDTRRHLEHENRTLALILREQGVSWSTIGRALGIDRTSALRRYRGESLSMVYRVDQEQMLLEDEEERQYAAALEAADL